MSTPDLGVELEALAERIKRIRPVGRNGDADPFYEDRSQCVLDAFQLAHWQRKGRPPVDYKLSADRGPTDDRRQAFRQRRS